MQIAVLSGKGGTGKTTVATNLAMVNGFKYVDCDVEEPNGFLFLNPDIYEESPVTIPVPSINGEACIGCKKCVEACQFNALVYVNGIMSFPELCHGCGACVMICPTHAIKEEPRTIGLLQKGQVGDNECMSGILNISEPMAGPIISKMKEACIHGDYMLDLSPGASCNVVKALHGVDFAILVTEPTVFGLHDLKIAIGLLEDMSISFGVIVNRASDDEDMITIYCKDNGHPILGKIPFKRDIAMRYSKGELLINEEEYAQIFNELWLKAKEMMICS